MLDELLASTPYGIPQDQKEDLLLQGLNDLTKFHAEHCAPYQFILQGIWDGKVTVERLSDIPYLPVTLFKRLSLSSVAAEDITLTLTSSGTTGQAVSQIAVDKETSLRQARSLSHSVAHVLGKSRLPMLVLDSSIVFKDPSLMSARGAGVLGMMRFGHRPVFALDENMQPDIEAIRTMIERLDGAPFFMFGFTYMVWEILNEKLANENIDLSGGVLIHSGGWKKMIEKSVDNQTFKNRLREQLGIQRIFNFYGMVEQIGSIFLEGDDGLLYPPSFSEVIVRHPETWQECAFGEEGVIQVLSLIPRSYPGHSLLTEDTGIIESVSSEGPFLGKGLRVTGRVKKAELRGCSDVIASSTNN